MDESYTLGNQRHTVVGWVAYANSLIVKGTNETIISFPKNDRVLQWFIKVTKEKFNSSKNTFKVRKNEHNSIERLYLLKISYKF